MCVIVNLLNFIGITQIRQFSFAIRVIGFGHSHHIMSLYPYGYAQSYTPKSYLFIYTCLTIYDVFTCFMLNINIMD
jgi:hypothetical protein